LKYGIARGRIEARLTASAAAGVAVPPCDEHHSARGRASESIVVVHERGGTSMLSKFDDRQPLKDARTIRACGPIDWKGQQGQCWMSVTITQNGVTATGKTGSLNQGDTKWECNADVQGSGQLQPNASAQAEGVIHVTQGPAADPWPEQTVTLVPEA
jgi:hypothetical protein